MAQVRSRRNVASPGRQLHRTLANKVGKASWTSVGTLERPWELMLHPNVNMNIFRESAPWDSWQRDRPQDNNSGLQECGKQKMNHRPQSAG